MDPALYSALTVNSLARGYVRRAPCLEPKNSVPVGAPGQRSESERAPKSDSAN
jgi:hypothetical protein